MESLYEHNRKSYTQKLETYEQHRSEFPNSPEKLMQEYSVVTNTLVMLSLSSDEFTFRNVDKPELPYFIEKYYRKYDSESTDIKLKIKTNDDKITISDLKNQLKIKQGIWKHPKHGFKQTYAIEIRHNRTYNRYIHDDEIIILPENCSIGYVLI
jgi:hypothetical protein